ncbi:hypothetical protein [Paraflavitalea pollutisoli]|uniref:hypothetical protein n=1 Tax=Paraflavitalea pollutisoli TaxID=3034143 RepID=UPI0023EDC506|nr:hypothetical protein [Paraflavitalea sp. H1-2-19X]
MFKNSLIRACLILGVVTAGIVLVAATRAFTKAEEGVCSEAAEACEKAKAHGEFMILEALNRAVMTTTR